ncbi:MAG: 6-pyruvoyl tetrahydropterin synthase family protein [Candidatus Saliniplasma sp.]
MIRLELNGWDAHIGFSASHLLPGHYKCGRIHGHNYALNARILGEESPEGLVFDFLPLKKKLRKIADELDHKLMLARGMEGLEKNDEGYEIRINGKRYVFPEEDVVLLDIDQATTEELARYLLEKVIDDIDFPETIKVVEIGVDESRGQGAWARRKL